MLLNRQGGGPRIQYKSVPAAKYAEVAVPKGRQLKDDKLFVL
jgi:hypothetical protein